MIVAGFGGSARAGIASFRAVLRAVLHDAAEGRPVVALAAPEGRCPALDALADELSIPLIRLSPSRIRGLDTPTRSRRSLALMGCGSVAEACALAAAGPDSRLLAVRHISPDRLATSALAEGQDP